MELRRDYSPAGFMAIPKAAGRESENIFRIAKQPAPAHRYRSRYPNDPAILSERRDQRRKPGELNLAIVIDEDEYVSRCVGHRHVTGIPESSILSRQKKISDARQWVGAVPFFYHQDFN
jgi:hypothetical protein